MYKNAEKVLNGKENVTKAQIRNSIAQARIELNVRKINSMVHLIQPPSHDEVILPKSGVEGSAQVSDYDEMHKIRNEDQKMKLRLLKSASLVPPVGYNSPLTIYIIIYSHLCRRRWKEPALWTTTALTTGLLK